MSKVLSSTLSAPNPKSQTMYGRLPKPSNPLERLISLPDRYPCMRYVYDITIIAIAIIAIVSILIVSQGQGLLLFGLIPGFVLSTLGLAMLISDAASTSKAQKIADTLTAIFLPFILLGMASLLLATASVASGGSILIVANPLFSMGVMTIGLSLISLHKVTFQHFKTEALIKEQKKISQFTDQSSTPLGPSKQYLSDEKLLTTERKSPASIKSQQTHQAQQARLAARQKRIRHSSQGNIVLHKKNSIHTLLSNGYEPDFSSDIDSPSQEEEVIGVPNFTPPSLPYESCSNSNLSLIIAPLGNVSSPLIKSRKLGQENSPLLRKVNRTESSKHSGREKHKREDEQSSPEEEKHRKKKSKRRKK
ncbi:IncV family inclusion membrane protein [Chlamydia gallinacea]|uniref:IncV family inclusion membrane protein n=1 Tax=Chlamydia gallinacea TaxID=1457153 RepID=A0ABS7ISN2_9CHLA|nr:IncV family inclusion membrane protein [Chlamydia gallinacea]MBX6680451.1 IncV family inclusion membrane protein [Chlamydia gallinacea]